MVSKFGNAFPFTSRFTDDGRMPIARASADWDVFVSMSHRSNCMPPNMLVPHMAVKQ